MTFEQAIITKSIPLDSYWISIGDDQHILLFQFKKYSTANAGNFYIKLLATTIPISFSLPTNLSYEIYDIDRIGFLKNSQPISNYDPEYITELLLSL